MTTTSLLRYPRAAIGFPVTTCVPTCLPHFSVIAILRVFSLYLFYMAMTCLNTVFPIVQSPCEVPTRVSSSSAPFPKPYFLWAKSVCLPTLKLLVICCVCVLQFSPVNCTPYLPLPLPLWTLVLFHYPHPRMYFISKKGLFQLMAC